MSEAISLYLTKSTAGPSYSDNFIDRFRDEHPTDLDCTEALVKLIEPEAGFNCRCCSRQLRERRYGDKMVRCKCGTRNFLLADSMFKNIRRPDAWWGYFCSLKDRWHVSSAKFAETFETSSSTSHGIFRTFMTVVRSEQCTGKLVSSAEFISLFIKRSYETEARMHPSSEETSLNNQEFTDIARNPSPNELQPPTPPDLNQDEKVVYNLLSLQPIQSSEIYTKAQMPAHQVSIALTLLELKGCIRPMPGDLWSRVGQQPAPTRELKKHSKFTLSTVVFDAFNDFIRDIHHGMSRKYSQNYLALFWYHVARSRWTIGALRRACRASPPISQKETFGDITPQQVRVSIREKQVTRA